MAGMSSEEDDVRQVGSKTVSVFLVKLCFWRAPAITEYLRYIDDTSENVVIRGTRGSKAIPRIRVDSKNTSRVPTGLPHKMYDATWLETQERDDPYYVKEELQVSEEAFELLVQVARSS